MAIIFDLGRVVVSWDPVGIVRSVRGPDGAEALAELLFNHPDWPPKSIIVSGEIKF